MNIYIYISCPNPWRSTSNAPAPPCTRSLRPISSAWRGSAGDSPRTWCSSCRATAAAMRRSSSSGLGEIWCLKWLVNVETDCRNYNYKPAVLETTWSYYNCCVSEICNDNPAVLDMTWDDLMEWRNETTHTHICFHPTRISMFIHRHGCWHILFLCTIGLFQPDRMSEIMLDMMPVCISMPCRYTSRQYVRSETMSG